MAEKGLSVFISSMLLVIFAVAIVGVIGPWGEDLFEGFSGDADENTDSYLEGRDAMLELKEVRIDRFKGYLNLTMRNTGTVDLESLRADILCENGDVVNENIGGELERGETVIEDGRNPGLVGCKATKVRFYDTEVDGFGKDYERISQPEYTPIPLEDGGSEQFNGAVMFLRLDGDYGDLNGDVDSYTDLSRISPGGFNKDYGSGGVGSMAYLADGRFVSVSSSSYDVIYWDITDLEKESIGGENFSVTENYENLTFIDTGTSKLPRLTGLSGTEFTYYNRTENKVDLYDVGDELGGTEEKIVETIKIKPGTATWRSLSLVPRVGDRAVLFFNSTEGLSKIYSFGENSDGETRSSTSTPIISAERAGDYLIVGETTESFNNENISVYRVPDNLNNVFEQDPVNVYRGHGDDTPIGIEYLGEGKIASSSYALGEGGDTEVHIWDLDDSERREDAGNIYDVSSITTLNSNGLNSLIMLNSNFATLVDPMNDRSLGDSSLRIDFGNSDFDFGDGEVPDF